MNIPTIDGGIYMWDAEIDLLRFMNDVCDIIGVGVVFKSATKWDVHVLPRIFSGIIQLSVDLFN